MMHAMDRTITIHATDGPLDVHLTEAGSGPPLLLLHGWPQHAHIWRRVAALLENDFRLLMPDLRGFGRSATPGHGYHPRQFASDAIALLDALRRGSRRRLATEPARRLGHWTPEERPDAVVAAARELF
jgi:alpha-beta hydrolase superfamily lysophospholipase